MSSHQVQPLESRICLSVSYAPPVLSPVGPVSEMATGDFNGDGRADLAVWGGSNTTSNAHPVVRILAGNGEGKFHPIGRAWVRANVSDLESADLNGDGRLDLVVANDNPQGRVTVMLGNGNGTFRSARSYFVGAQTQDVVVGDFNRDRIPDIMAANLGMWSPLPNSDQPSRFGAGLLRGLGRGNFAHVAMIPLIDGQTHVVAGDVDGNGRLDAVFGGPFSLSLAPVSRALIHVALNRPANSDARFVVSQFSPFFGRLAGLALTHLNDDRLADLAAVQDFRTDAGIGSATLHTLLSKGDGTFSPVSSVNAEVDRPAGLSVGDVDRDGKADFVVTGAVAGPVIAIYPPPGAASVLLGNGDGSVAAPQLFRAGSAPAAQLLTSVNRDRLLDIVTGAVDGVSAILNTTTPIIDRPTVSSDLLA